MNGSGFTDAARARLIAAYEACELAELARAAVPIGEHELSPASASAYLAEARGILLAAQRFYEAAAVFAGSPARHRPDETDWWRAHTARDPLETALDLDDWVLRHQDGNGDLGPAPVSGGLSTHRGLTG